MKKLGYFTTYRHFRRDSGAATAACVVRHLGMGVFDIVAGFSFCSPEDFFSRKAGRDYATERLMKNPIVLKNVRGVAPALMKHLRSISDNLLLSQAFEEMGIAEYKHAMDRKHGNFDMWFLEFVREL